ncbi:MAG: hypothetical protein M1813_009680 [Trichoglossum hirsutum]|nr:MAG: hypothetical protein M1813_009680 [Trichoglossum hirsutum]
MLKRARGHDQDDQDELRTSSDGLLRGTSSPSPASKLNLRVLKKLQKEFNANPEVDLMSKFPTDYSNRLARVNQPKEGPEFPPSLPSVAISPHLRAHNDVDSLLPPLSATAIVFPLSPSVQDILGINERHLSGLDRQTTTAGIREPLANVIRTGEILWRSKACDSHAVIKCRLDIVIKIVPGLKDYTESTSMQYLEENIPEIPAPRHLGLITVGKMSYMFMSFIPGTTLDEIWPQLHEKQKASISNQLNELFLKLRQLGRPDNMPLGGVNGEGCKDTRRHTRVSKIPIYNGTEFENFVFSDPHFGGTVYITVLRGLLMHYTSNYVFTHGDVRPANIMVRHDDHGSYVVTGLLDWEKSGFYSDSFECMKATSTMSTLETNDWFLHLPACIAPYRHPIQWLLDRLWDKHVA